MNNPASRGSQQAKTAMRHDRYRRMRKVLGYFPPIMVSTTTNAAWRTCCERRPSVATHNARTHSEAVRHETFHHLTVMPRNTPGTSAQRLCVLTWNLPSSSSVSTAATTRPRWRGAHGHAEGQDEPMTHGRYLPRCTAFRAKRPGACMRTTPAHRGWSVTRTGFLRPAQGRCGAFRCGFIST